MKYLALSIIILLSGCLNLSKDAEKNEVQAPDGLQQSQQGEISGAEANINKVRLSWTQPTEYENDEFMSENKITAFYVYWGKDPDALNNIEPVSADAREIEMTGFEKGTYYFAIIVETITGNTSLLSNITSKTFE